MKICLVVIYNHKYEKNIQIIRQMYHTRFSSVIQLMPFYDGNETDVISVFGGSFLFHSFIAQAKNKLLEIECDRFFFIGDDLILNPRLNENNICEYLNLDFDSCFIQKFYDVSKGFSYRGTTEAHNFNYNEPGVDSTCTQRIPSYEEAFSILNNKGLLYKRELKEIKPFYLLFDHPVHKNIYKNYKVLKSRIWHFSKKLKYNLLNYKVSYPVVFGYSDIFSIPKSHFPEFCKYLEVFTTLKVFVELAIPTTFALHDWKIVTEDKINLKIFDVWFPAEPSSYEEKIRIIENISEKANYSISKLDSAFPEDFLSIHPIKLSKWKL